MKNIYLSMPNGKGYDAQMLVKGILGKYPKIRESSNYQTVTDRLIDYTMACDRSEQQDWMLDYMRKSIELDNEAKRMVKQGGHDEVGKVLRFEAAVAFLVAYDLIAM